MFSKSKIAAVLIAGSFAITSCGSEYKPDTSLPISQQIAASGVASFETSDDNWELLGFGLCNYELASNASNVDEAMIELGMDRVWDKKERAVVANVLYTNECPEKITK